MLWSGPDVEVATVGKAFANIPTDALEDTRTFSAVLITLGFTLGVKGTLSVAFFCCDPLVCTPVFLVTEGPSWQSFSWLLKPSWVMVLKLQPLFTHSYKKSRGLWLYSKCRHNVCLSSAENPQIWHCSSVPLNVLAKVGANKGVADRPNRVEGSSIKGGLRFLKKGHAETICTASSSSDAKVCLVLQDVAGAGHTSFSAWPGSPGVHVVASAPLPWLIGCA